MMLETMVYCAFICQLCNSMCSKQSAKVGKSTVFHSVLTSSHLSISVFFGSAIGLPMSTMNIIISSKFTFLQPQMAGLSKYTCNFTDDTYHNVLYSICSTLY